MMMPMSACGWRGFGLTQRNVSRLFWPRTTLVLVAVWCCLSPLGTAHSERGALPGILENALRLVDLNGNGLISKSEFQASVFNFYNNRVSDDQDVTPEQVRKLFSSGDVDGDENLDVEETTRLLSGRMAYMSLMTQEDVQVWLEACSDLREYRAHFLDRKAQGRELMSLVTHSSQKINAGTEPLTQQDVQSAVVGALLVKRSEENITVPPVTVIEQRATLVTVRLTAPSASYIVRYKLQVCRTSAQHNHWGRGTSVPQCGFGVLSVWPSSNVDTVRIVGLSPLTSYQIEVRAFNCDGRSHVSIPRHFQTTVKPTNKDILLSPSKWMRMCFLPPPQPEAPQLVSRTARSVILEWGKTCRVASSHLRWAQECPTIIDSQSLVLGAVQLWLHRRMYCRKQRFLISYQRVDKQGDALFNAPCAQNDEESAINDNPLDCHIRGLAPGKMYIFHLRVETDNGLLSKPSQGKRVMTHCEVDSDCKWGGTNASCSPHTKLCDGLDPSSFMKDGHDNDSLRRIGLPVVMLAVLVVGSWAILQPRSGSARLKDARTGEETATQFGPNLLNLQRKRMERLDCWIDVGSIGERSFERSYFSSAFDARFGDEIYRFVRYLSGGSFGRVFLGKKMPRRGCLRRFSRVKTEDRVAIKFIQTSHGMMRDVLPFESVDTRTSPYVCQVLYYSTTPTLWSAQSPSAPPYRFVVMEVAAFGEVSNYFHSACDRGADDQRARNAVPKPFPEEVALRIFHQLVQALEWLHKKQFVHLDIKLENILLNVEGDVKLIDFGCCRYVTGEHASADLENIGSPVGRAPELEDPENPSFGVRSDIWSCGVALLSMLHGTALMQHPELEMDEKYWRYLGQRSVVQTLLETRDVPVSRPLKNLLYQLLQMNPDGRPASMAEIRDHEWVRQRRPAGLQELASFMVKRNRQVVEHGIEVMKSAVEQGLRRGEFYHELCQALETSALTCASEPTIPALLEDFFDFLGKSKQHALCLWFCMQEVEHPAQISQEMLQRALRDTFPEDTDNRKKRRAKHCLQRLLKTITKLEFPALVHEPLEELEGSSVLIRIKAGGVEFSREQQLWLSQDCGVSELAGDRFLLNRKRYNIYQAAHVFRVPNDGPEVKTPASKTSSASQASGDLAFRSGHDFSSPRPRRGTMFSPVRSPHFHALLGQDDECIEMLQSQKQLRQELANLGALEALSGSWSSGKLTDVDPKAQAELYHSLAMYRWNPGQEICGLGHWVYGPQVVCRGAAVVSARAENADSSVPQLGHVYSRQSILHRNAVNSLMYLSPVTFTASEEGCTTMRLDTRTALRILNSYTVGGVRSPASPESPSQ